MASSRGKISLAEHRLRHHAPDLAEDRVRALGAIWDEVVGRIIRTMLARDDDYKPDLHVNVRAEMTNLLAHMSLFLTERVIDQRLGERRPEDIDPQAERAACFDAAGLADIEGTAANAHVVWRRRLDERWVPKSRKALDREASPPPPKPIAVKPVADKHFISKWFIRDHWAQGQTATRWRRAGDGWSRATIPFGRWAYRQHLWSDRLEAYFALIEGEAKRPVLGYRFVPRLRDLQDRRLAFIGAKPRHKILDPLVGRPIRTDVIEENWPDIIRLTASLKAGLVAPSVMLKKLSVFKRQNRLDMGLAEVGRIERPLFTLDWLESPELRRRCQAGLNKSEARHALAQAVFVHKQGRIADRTLQNQEHRASGLNLVIAQSRFGTHYICSAPSSICGRGAWPHPKSFWATSHR